MDMAVREMLGITSVVAVVASTALAAALHMLRADLDPISRYESEYAGGPYSFLMTLVFVLRGVAAISLLASLYVSMERTPSSLSGLALLGMFGVGMWLLAIFPTDMLGAPDTPTGAIHNWVALVAFVAIAIAAPLLTAGLGNQEGMLTFQNAIWVVALGVILACAFFFAAPWVGIHGISGLNERVFLTLTMLWIALAAVRS